MAQSPDFIVDDGSGVSLLAQLNTMMAALVSSNSGSTPPPAPVAGQLWLDQGVIPNVLRQRNSANSGWFVNNPEAVPANTIWGNNGSFAAPMNSISMPALEAMMGFTFSNAAVKEQQIGGGMRFYGGSGVTGATAGVRVTYPVAFAAPPVIIAFPFSTAIARQMTGRDADNTGITIQGWDTAGAPAAVVFSWIAFGK